MGKKIKGFLLVALLGLIAFAAAIWAWRQSVVARRAAISAEVIPKSLEVKDFVAARSALAGLADPEVRSSKEREIRKAEVSQAIDIRDTGLLRLALGNDAAEWMSPQLLESADLVLAREAVQTADFSTYSSLASKWKSAAAFPGQWLLLEADQLLARRQTDEALAFLKSASLSGPEDALRLARLALLEAREPWKAMDTLDLGLKADPLNADLLSFRAQIQEAGGRPEDARLDYVAAVISDRKNPLHRDVLGNFYLRHGDLSAAAETWRDAAEDSGLGVYALKGWFWSRLSGVPLSKPLPECRQVGWSEFVAALAAAPQELFWSGAMESAIGGVSGGAKRPEVLWLRLLESIRTKDYETARTGLGTGFPREAESLWPGMAIRLLATLTALDGQNPSLALVGRDLPPLATDDDTHAFIRDFAHWASRKTANSESEAFPSWLARPEALIGTLFASGWPGAAVMVGNADQLSPVADGPAWFDYGYAKSMLLRGDRAPVQKWLESLPKRTEAADLLLGEILLTGGSVDQGLARLHTIASSGSPLASRARWTLALTELDRGNTAKARELTLADASFAESIQGQELLARAALALDDRKESMRIYEKLGDQSADAMIFLSKEAFAVENFADARRWTLTLARRFPEQPEFRKNLLKIDEAEAAKSKKP